MEESEIIVIKQEQFGTYRQILRPPSKDICEFLCTIERSIRAGKFTGQVILHVNQGSIKQAETIQKTGAIPEESTAGRALNGYFSRNGL